MNTKLLDIEEHKVAINITNKKLFDSNSVIIDCGACIGSFTKPLYDRYKCNFYLYEPDPRNYRRLCRRFKDCMRIKIMDKAIDTFQGEIEFHLGNYITASSKYASHRGLGNLIENVKTTTLDWELRHLERINLLKLDLEGSEKEVIPQISKEILQKINQIIVEYHLQSEIDGYTQYDIDKCRNHLKECDFTEVYYGKQKPNAGYDGTYINKRLL